MLDYHGVVGHEQIMDHLRKAISTEKLSHAYILAGEEGMGRKTIAHALSLTLLCERGGLEPCMECHACKQVIAQTHPDLIHITHDKASIGVDDIREQISDTVDIKPYSGSYKIYIIDEADKMTAQAQNALLKTIEEPPAYAVIILLTTNEELLLPTIRSRCVVMELKPLRDDLVCSFLIESMDVSPNDAQLYATWARGNLGRAIAIASSSEFKQLQEEDITILKSIHVADTRAILRDIEILKQRSNCNSFLESCRLWYRDILIYKTTKDMDRIIFRHELKAILDISNRSDYAAFEKILEAIDKTEARLKANVSTELTLELLLLKMKEN